MKVFALKRKAVPEISVLAQYKDLDAQIKALQDKKDEVKASILSLMDEQETNEILIGNDKAVRKELIQERIDSKLVREILGEEVSKVIVTSTQIRLTVI